MVFEDSDDYDAIEEKSNTKEIQNSDMVNDYDKYRMPGGFYEW